MISRKYLFKFCIHLLHLLLIVLIALLTIVKDFYHVNHDKMEWEMETWNGKWKLNSHATF